MSQGDHICIPLSICMGRNDSHYFCQKASLDRVTSTKPDNQKLPCIFSQFVDRITRCHKETTYAFHCLYAWVETIAIISVKRQVWTESLLQNLIIKSCHVYFRNLWIESQDVTRRPHMHSIVYMHG